MTIILFTSCNKNLRQVNKTLESNKIDFNYFKTKAKLKYSANGESITASMNLRIQNSKIIWISVSKFGKEAMRAKLMPDSTHYLNKYPVKERYYKVFPTQEYLNKAGLDIDFQGAQDLIFGKHPLKINKKDKVEVTEDNIHIIQVRNNVRIESDLNPENSLLKSATIISNTDTLDLEYNKYESVDKQLIPTKFEFRISKVENNERQISVATIDFSSPKFVEEKPSFSFKVPNSYEKR